MNDNLSNRIWCAKNQANDLPTHLTENQQTELLRMIGSGCRKNTKQRLERMIGLPLSLWNNYGIFTRVVFDQSKDEASYICGQSWTDEMRTIRECILN